jgi:glycerol-3-phosphate acyltransferase PlsX
LKRFYGKLDPSQYDGASFLGLNKVVIKSHGNTNIDGFYSALNSAMLEVKSDLPNRVEKALLN